MTRTVFIAGAASGGHLYPGIALAQSLTRLCGCTPHFLTTGRDLEKRILGPTGFESHVLPAPCWSRPAQLWGVRGHIKALFRSQRPQAVIGLGGGPSLLPGLAAATHLIPLFLLEQNRVVGRANHWLLPLARRLFTSYRDTAGSRWLARRAVFYGCPVRSTFEPAPLDDGKPILLVLGGSQGAEQINRLMVECLPGLGRDLPEFGVKHVTGPGKDAGVVEAYRQAGISAEVHEYLDDPAPALRSAALVLARAGGTTLAETLAVGRGSLLVPYPHHKDRQQFHNAEALVGAGAAEIVAGDASALGARLRALLSDRDRLQRMATAALGLGVVDSADRIATVIGVHLDVDLAGKEPVVTIEGAS